MGAWIRRMERPLGEDSDGEELQFLDSLTDAEFLTCGPTADSMHDVDLNRDFQPISMGPGFACSSAGYVLNHRNSAQRHRQNLCCLSRRTLLSLLAGQGLALVLTSIGASNQLLAGNGFRWPMLQSCLCYSSIAVVWLPIAWRQGHLQYIWRDWRWAKLAVLGAVEAEANYAAVSAYQYTSMVSVQLLDNLSVPLVLLLSILVLKIRYRVGHIAGALICLAGVVILIIYDACTGDSEGDQQHHSVYGDLYMVAAACLYAISNVSQEVMLKKMDAACSEWLAGVGLSAAVLTGLQAVVMEADCFDVHQWDPKVLPGLISVVVLTLLFYSFTPFFVRTTSAVYLNLSLLSSDCYAAFVGAGAFLIGFPPVYFLSFAMATGGVALYSSLPEPKCSSGEKAGCLREYSLEGLDLSSANLGDGEVEAEECGLVGCDELEPHTRAEVEMHAASSEDVRGSHKTEEEENNGQTYVARHSKP